jgi:hypothetical protein
MKKYCECYAGSVKCSINCRCVDCKNQPPGGFGKDSRSAGDLAPVGLMDSATDEGTRLLGGKGQRAVGTGKREPSWMMDAAQNLVRQLRHSMEGNVKCDERCTPNQFFFFSFAGIRRLS